MNCILLPRIFETEEMKQNILTALVVVLLICVGVLFYLHFKANGGSSVTVNPVTGVKTAETAQYLFVNIDSVAQNYLLTEEKGRFLEAKANERAQKFQAKQGAYTAAMRELEVRQRTDTERQLQPLIEKIQRLEGELMQMQQELQQETMLDQQALTTTITDSLKKVAQEIAIEKKADFVIPVGETLPVALYYNPTLDITLDATKRLNDRYKPSATETPAASTPANK